MRPRRSALLVATGVVIALLPWVLDGDVTIDGAGDVVFIAGLVALTALPFVLLAVVDPQLPPALTWGLYALLVIGDLALIAGTTTDSSSTGAVGYLLLPVYGLLLAGIGILAASVTRRRARRRSQTR